MWVALSDKRTGLSFTIAAGLRQCSHSQVRVSRESWPYFTVWLETDPTFRARSPYLYPPGTGCPGYTPGTGLPVAFPLSFTTRRATVEVIEQVIYPPHGPHRKRIIHSYMYSRCRWNICTELFPSNGCCIVAYLHSRYLAMGLYVTIYTLQSSEQLHKLLVETPIHVFL
jgi:hypothetical protein